MSQRLFLLLVVVLALFASGYGLCQDGECKDYLKRTSDDPKVRVGLTPGGLSSRVEQLLKLSGRRLGEKRSRRLSGLFKIPKAKVDSGLLKARHLSSMHDMARSIFGSSGNEVLDVIRRPSNDGYGGDLFAEMGLRPRIGKIGSRIGGLKLMKPRISGVGWVRVGGGGGAVRFGGFGRARLGGLTRIGNLEGIGGLGGGGGLKGLGRLGKNEGTGGIRKNRRDSDMNNILLGVQGALDQVEVSDVTKVMSAVVSILEAQRDVVDAKNRKETHAEQKPYSQQIKSLGNPSGNGNIRRATIEGNPPAGEPSKPRKLEGEEESDQAEIADLSDGLSVTNATEVVRAETLGNTIFGKLKMPFFNASSIINDDIRKKIELRNQGNSDADGKGCLNLGVGCANITSNAGKMGLRWRITRAADKLDKEWKLRRANWKLFDRLKGADRKFLNQLHEFQKLKFDRPGSFAKVKRFSVVGFRGGKGKAGELPLDAKKIVEPVIDGNLTEDTEELYEDKSNVEGTVGLLDTSEADEGTTEPLDVIAVEDDLVGPEREVQQSQ